MSKIRELKSNTNNTLNFIDVLELFSPDKKSKYTETLLRLMNRTKNYNDHVDDMKRDILSKFDFIKMEDLDKFGQTKKVRKVLIHINNTNPILREDSAERAILSQHNIEVAFDGMDIIL